MTTEQSLEAGRVLDVPIDHLEPDPDQPRQSFPEKPLQELADNIKMRGILQ
ncbi:MAG: ParB N-terminal domain-containing protein, partial [Gammaproteobacteria bacterium]|nr:ParB N-terminal domain-containing protein [Gammaproteobacteria bacterium]NIR29684.1 ParB N-terminal domain-containing protein [Gammaproteobacteria bacterium]NIR83261.1 ParB N-terminal domain-containing protein [Gammaproteobacteria bacterium]NIU04428.1 ParB N-terminal domain-containing protein [Gammaproteobacteria bacterium]NIV51585.1 ParB N-terminal domain-containing protein [Gammaproteobacteria bacterium]